MSREHSQSSLRRTLWRNDPEVVIHSGESAVKQHPLYERSKSGDATAAEGLVLDCISQNSIETIRALCTDADIALLAVHALETEGMNAIPRVFARILSRELNLPVVRGVIQSNTVAHTGSSGYHRLAFPALFEGQVHAGRYILVDDFVGQGGTLANLRGHIEHQGAKTIGMTVLTGRTDSASIGLAQEALQQLRRKHGEQLEEWWIDTFGYGLEKLTNSEARYLTRVDSFDLVRERITDARRARDR